MLIRKTLAKRSGISQITNFKQLKARQQEVEPTASAVAEKILCSKPSVLRLEVVELLALEALAMFDFSKRGARLVAGLVRLYLPLARHLKLEAFVPPAPAGSADLGDGTFIRPVLHADASDPDAVPGGDGWQGFALSPNGATLPAQLGTPSDLDVLVAFPCSRRPVGTDRAQTVPRSGAGPRERG